METVTYNLCVIKVFDSNGKFLGYHNKNVTYMHKDDILKATLYTPTNANKAIAFHYKFNSARSCEVVPCTVTFNI